MSDDEDDEDPRAYSPEPEVVLRYRRERLSKLVKLDAPKVIMDGEWRLVTKAALTVLVTKMDEAQKLAFCRIVMMPSGDAQNEALVRFLNENRSLA